MKNKGSNLVGTPETVIICGYMGREIIICIYCIRQQRDPSSPRVHMHNIINYNLPLCGRV